MRQRFALLLLTAAGTAGANEITLLFETGVVAPSFRGDANTTYLGWDTFDSDDEQRIDPDDGPFIFEVINDTTPDIGADGGSFVTANDEDHKSGSGNYYSGFGAVSEAVSFDTAGVNGSGFTTVIVQAQTLFGQFGAPIAFTPINGFAPSLVVSGTNATGKGQLFVKYELPGTADPQTFSMISGPFSFNSFDKFVIDTAWSPIGFAPATDSEIPEPAAALLALTALGASLARRR